MWHHRDCQRLVITFKELKFTELQIKIRNHISLLPGDALRKVHTVPCKAFKGYELPAAPWLQFFRTAYPAKVCDEICICGIGLSIPI